MGYSVIILDGARREYEAIVDYLAITLGSPAAARGFMDEFDRQVGMIREHPEMRPLCAVPELASQGFRSCRCGRYLFLYSVSEERVEIAHVFHQSRDYARLV